MNQHASKRTRTGPSPTAYGSTSFSSSGSSYSASHSESEVCMRRLPVCHIHMSTYIRDVYTVLRVISYRRTTRVRKVGRYSRWELFSGAPGWKRCVEIGEVKVCCVLPFAEEIVFACHKAKSRFRMMTQMELASLLAANLRMDVNRPASSK